ncbi:hypothetical protein Lupro_02025 [Lutibacter profundi]|uniref:DUF2971 domain-containing protein n=1 Tax=Lutibacter profundi TaxID=1622118 RepID=A0A0X8G4W6_9FLAO|nr:DUF2971 domain-containing protein [Lutibacter profundi]AMC10099.1 hypothetical protein Lupro_02025 [Lutibacter profundi]
MEKDKIKLLTTKLYTEKYELVTSFDFKDISHIRHKKNRDIKEELNPKYIYKYFNNEKHNLESLAKNYFYLSHPKDFNDPFDCLNNLPYSKLSSDVNSMGVCCFSQIRNISPMWGNYANNYKGFCLKIDTEKLKNKNRNIFFSKVIYEKNIQNLINFESLNKIKDELKKSNDFSDKDKRHILEVVKFFYRTSIKYKNWSYEKEYRFISPSIINNERNLKFNINCIEEIYIGYKMKLEKPEFYRKLTNILKGKYKHVKIFIVKPDTVDLKLNFLPIKQ